MSKKPKSPKKKRGLFNGVLFKLLTAAVFIGCAVLLITTEKDRSDKKKELESIQSKITEYENQNKELQNALDNDDTSGYMEKYAMEERGYAYPDEWRFYDVSRD